MTAKRLFFLLAAAVAVLPAWCQYDFSAPCATGVTLYYRVAGDSGTVYITHPQAEWPYYDGAGKPSGAVEIPNTVEHGGRLYTVVSVGENAFYGCDSITSVAFGYECRSIGPQAFYGCKGLTSVRFRAGLLEVGEGSFAYCSSLRAAVLPETVERIGLSAFAYCTGLIRAWMPDVAWNTCNSLTFLGCKGVGEGKNAKNDGSGGIILLPLE